jgi:hypothetical protein
MAGRIEDYALDKGGDVWEFLHRRTPGPWGEQGRQGDRGLFTIARKIEAK